MPNVAAIIVTYNRPQLLNRSIAATLQQSHPAKKIYIINNNSEIETEEIINFHKHNTPGKIVHIKLNKNLGGAGGFYHGLKIAYENDHELFWLMDDDTIPDKNTLLELVKTRSSFLKNIHSEPAFVCSNVLWKNGEINEMNIAKPTWDWNRKIDKIDNFAICVESCSFVSMLIHRDQVKSKGFPIKDFFIWYDDIEYSTRLRSTGATGLISIHSKVIHETPTPWGVDIKLLNSENAWKFCYGLRNEGSYRLKNIGPINFIIFLLRTTRQLMKSNAQKRVKIKVMNSLISALFFEYKIEKP